MPELEFIGPRRRAHIISTFALRGHWEGTHKHRGYDAHMRLDLIERTVAYSIRWQGQERKGTADTVAAALAVMQGWLSAQRHQPGPGQASLFLQPGDYNLL